MSRYVEIGRVEHRSANRRLATDNAYAVRVVAWACWRYHTGASPQDGAMRYLETVDQLSDEPYFPPPAEYWTWYEGERGYQTINEALAKALEQFHGDLYVEKGVELLVDQIAWGEYKTDYGDNSGRAAAALIRELDACGAIEYRSPISTTLHEELLDAWVASKLIQFDDARGF